MSASNRHKKIDKRNYALVARYYYWTELERLRFDDTLRVLSDEEFFVAERTITNTINEYTHFLDSLIIHKATPADLRRMFPSWSFEISKRNESRRELFSRFVEAS